MEHTKYYEDMSREDLIAIIGGNVDPETSRAELIMMAMEADS